MAEPIQCPGCFATNPPNATSCRTCGRALRGGPARGEGAPQVVLRRATGGEESATRPGESTRRPTAKPVVNPAHDVTDLEVASRAETPIEDNSDVIAQAIDRIRTKAQTAGHRFKPYVPSKGRRPQTPQSKQEGMKQLEAAIALLRDRRFEEAIEPLLRAIARDEEDRRPWILVAEAYLRIERPYKAAVGYLRALELAPKDEQAWLGIARVLEAIDDLATAAAVLDRASRVHPTHVDTWLERGLVFESLQDFSEARRSYGKVLEIRPDHRVARAKQKELEAKVSEAVGEAPSAPPESAPQAGPTVPPQPPSIEPVDSIPADLLNEMEDVLGPETDVATELVPNAAKAMESLSIVAPKTGVHPARVRTFVEGLDDILDGGVPRGHVVLIEGAPGTMKSSLGFSILLHNAVRAGLRCLYLSLEERRSSILKQMASLGLRLEVPKGSLVVLDPKSASGLVGEKADWVDGLREGIGSIKAQRGLDLVVIDSLEALEVLAKFKDRRREMFRLFEGLRDLDVTSFLITERPDWIVAGHVLQGRWDEDFLADGVIHLRMHMVSDLDLQRRLRVVKMRGSRHETGYLAMVLDDGRFRVTRAMSS